MEAKYKLHKVFDSRSICDESEELEECLLDYVERCEAINGSYLQFIIGQSNIRNNKYNKLNEWLLNNGAEPGEKVLIGYFW